MTAASAHQFLSFVEALAQGKTVTKKDGDGSYKVHTEYAFDGDPKDYRIEPDVPVEKSLGQVAFETWFSDVKTADWRTCPNDERWETLAQAVVEHLNETERHAAVKVLRQIIRDLPQNKDWLDPVVEREARTLIGEAVQP